MGTAATALAARARGGTWQRPAPHPWDGILLCQCPVWLGRLGRFLPPCLPPSLPSFLSQGWRFPVGRHDVAKVRLQEGGVLGFIIPGSTCCPFPTDACNFSSGYIIVVVASFFLSFFFSKTPPPPFLHLPSSLSFHKKKKNYHGL